MTRIGLNEIFIAPGVAGGHIYVDQLLPALAAAAPQDEFVVYTRRGARLPASSSGNVRQFEAPVSQSSLFWRTIWEYQLLPRRLSRDGIGIFHGLGGVSPASRGLPFVLTVHDLIYRHFPDPPAFSQFMRWMHPRVAPKADRVIVPSRRTAEEAIEYLGVRPERIRLVHYGPGNEFTRVSDPERIQATLGRLGLRRPFIVSVARAYVHKNLAGLVRAVSKLRELGHSPVQLVLVGDAFRAGPEVRRLAAELGLVDSVVFTGYVSQNDLNVLYSAAELFAFPSLAEGFGLPLLEAMACGTPVVASDASAIPEAVGEAGVLADARDADAFAAALAKVLEDTGLRATLRARGLERVKKFSWEKAAAQTIAVYREIA